MKLIYTIRLDDACEYIKASNWKRVEEILSFYSIIPLVGIIPKCEDDKLISFGKCADFVSMINRWKNKLWIFALHGFNHVYTTKSSGINPINHFSEFADVSLEIQKQKIHDGLEQLRNIGINPSVFFAPGHTFDLNTLVALKEESNIRIISDGISLNPYFEHDFTFYPAQIGKPRRFLFGFYTICLHPNTMREKDFVQLENFISKNRTKIIDFPCNPVKRKKTFFDRIFYFFFFLVRKIKNI
jgi:predicted deacetylase